MILALYQYAVACRMYSYSRECLGPIHYNFRVFIQTLLSSDTQRVFFFSRYFNQPTLHRRNKSQCFPMNITTKPKSLLCFRLILLFIVVVSQICIEFLKCTHIVCFLMSSCPEYIYHWICIFFFHPLFVFVMSLHFVAHI